MTEHEEWKEPAKVTLRPRFWTQRITRRATSEDTNDPTRSLHCEAAIISPLGVTLEGEIASVSSIIEEEHGADDDASEEVQRDWDDLVCEVAIYPGEASICSWQDESRRPIEKDVGLFNFNKGFIGSDVASPSINCWFTLDDKEFRDVWQRVSSDRQPEFIITLELWYGICGAYSYRDRRWHVEKNPSLQILSVDLRLTYAAPYDFEESTDRLRRRGWERANVDDALKTYLADNLLKLPKDIEDGQFFHSQFNKIATEVARRVAQYSKSFGEDARQLKDRLDDAFDVLTSIRSATNDKAHKNWSNDKESEEAKAERKKEEHTIWYHGQALVFYHQGFESDSARKVDVDYLQEQAQKYLLRPWMENEQLEWIIVDALAFSAVTSFGEEMKQQARGPFSLYGLNMAYFSAKGNLYRMAWKNVQYGLTKFALKVAIFLGAPIALGWYFWNRGREGEVINAGAFYGGLVMLYLVYQLLRWMLGKKKPQTIFGKNFDVFKDMLATYDMLKGRVTSPTVVRDRLLDTTRRGAVWPGGFFSILDHAIQRNSAVWFPWEEDKYPY